MSVITPAPSASRGEVVLQPTYFTSSLFVKAARDDITTLILTYHEQYTKTQPTQPFTLFKILWDSQGWKWMHFMVFDHRTRETFLNVVLRLFLERMVKTEAPYSRAIALFGLYTFFYTQPLDTAPILHHISHIPIPLDHYASLITLPNSLNADHLLALRPAVSHILSALLKDRVFFIVPSSELGPLNPRDLPREIFIDEASILPTDLKGPKKKGRPTRRDKIRKDKAALDNLDRWVEETPLIPLHSSPFSSISGAPEALATHVPAATLKQYQLEKLRLLDALYSGTADEHSVIRKANQFVLDRLKDAEKLVSADTSESATGESTDAGLARIRRVVEELEVSGDRDRMGGVLGLLEGAGRLSQ